MTGIDLFARRGPGGWLPSIADMIHTTGVCWEWTGLIRKGYGRVYADGNMRSVHRLMWETLVGPIPSHLQIDHLCKNKPCCNPDHLELVTSAENTHRGNAGWNSAIKTHCPQNHPLSGPNLYVDPRGCRGCRACRSESSARYLQRRTS